MRCGFSWLVIVLCIGMSLAVFDVVKNTSHILIEGSASPSKVSKMRTALDRALFGKGFKCSAITVTELDFDGKTHRVNAILAPVTFFNDAYSGVFLGDLRRIAIELLARHGSKATSVEIQFDELGLISLDPA